MLADNLTNKINENINLQFQNLKKDIMESFGQINAPINKNTKNNKIKDLNLSLRSENSLYFDNIFLISELCKKTEKELLKIPNFGKRCSQEVKEALAILGLKLKDG